MTTRGLIDASLKIDLLRPTPVGPELLLRSRPVEVGKRKVLIELSVYADAVECVRAQVVAARAPSTMCGSAVAR